MFGEFGDTGCTLGAVHCSKTFNNLTFLTIKTGIFYEWFFSNELARFLFNVIVVESATCASYGCYDKPYDNVGVHEQNKIPLCRGFIVNFVRDYEVIVQKHDYEERDVETSDKWLNESWKAVTGSKTKEGLKYLFRH